MEFELDRTQWDGFDLLLDTMLCREETMESIVPDACPDILRVVGTGGQALVESRTAGESRAEVTGCCKLRVLYVPDGESGLRHLEVRVPFTAAVEDAAISPGCQVVASVRLCSADTRALNPRKVLARCEVAVELTVLRPRSERVARCVTEGEVPVEQLTEERTVCPVVCVREKPFPIQDQMTLPGGKPAAVELLDSRVDFVSGDSKIIGNKLIFKGGIRVWVLYRGEDDSLCTSDAELPFSQILEVNGVAEEADMDLVLALTGVDCELNGADDGRTVAVDAQVLAQAVLREERTMEVLTDAYSTKAPLVAEVEVCPMETVADQGERTQSVREVWESPSPVREINDCRVWMGEVTQSREGEKLILSVRALVTALYTDEAGETFTAQWPVTVPCAIDLPQDCRCVARCRRDGEVYASPTAGGLEARFSLTFSWRGVSTQSIAAVSALREGEAPESDGERPSLVLRMLEPGERLWDMAKACGTTTGDIMSANELESPADAVGKLLLIPRRR